MSKGKVLPISNSKHYQLGLKAGLSWKCYQDTPKPPSTVFDEKSSPNYSIVKLVKRLRNASLWVFGFVDGITQAREEHDEIIYGIARLLRNTDGKPPATWGHDAGQLLVKLRQIDGGKYDRLVIQPAASSD